MNFESLLKVDKLFSLYLIPPTTLKTLNKGAFEDILMVPDGAPCRQTEKKKKKG